MSTPSESNTVQAYISPYDTIDVWSERENAPVKINPLFHMSKTTFQFIRGKYELLADAYGFIDGIPRLTNRSNSLAYLSGPSVDEVLKKHQYFRFPYFKHCCGDIRIGDTHFREQPATRIVRAHSRSGIYYARGKTGGRLIIKYEVAIGHGYTIPYGLVVAGKDPDYNRDCEAVLFYQAKRVIQKIADNTSITSRLKLVSDWFDREDATMWNLLMDPNILGGEPVEWNHE